MRTTVKKQLMSEAPPVPVVSPQYQALKESLARGWNNWNTRSVTSHVLLPEGFAVNLGLKDNRNGACLKEILIGRQGDGVETVKPGLRSADGRYISLVVSWRKLLVSMESATDPDGNWVVRIELLKSEGHLLAPALLVEAAMLWNRPGHLSRQDNSLLAHLPTGQVSIHATAAAVEDPWALATGPYLVLPLSGPLGLASGRPRSLAEIEMILKSRRAECEASYDRFGDYKEVAKAAFLCFAWDTIYDPQNDRVISPVSRIWSCGWGGYILFCWDNYFAGLIGTLGSKELAYATVIEITSEVVEDGFVPNGAGPHWVSRDRSQPPVGSAMVREIYRQYREKWLLVDLFPALLKWNRWWPQARDNEGLLCWGSNPYQPRFNAYWESNGVGERFGGALESGLDNSPMYDDIPFDKNRNQLSLQDAGLTSLFVMDCEALAELAVELGKTQEATELRARAATYRANLQRLWDEKSGIFRNRRTDTGEFSSRLSPTNFYPLLARAATPAQARRLVSEHLENPKEFGGDWVIPSISRDDPAYPDNTYWRGRIWAPMNFLVYMGLLNYDLPEARGNLARKSQELLLKEWLRDGHVHENYNADTGEGCDMSNSDRFYHWGGLLGVIVLMEAGLLPDPAKPLQEA